jgi:hypothetical protein
MVQASRGLAENRLVFGVGTLQNCEHSHSLLLIRSTERVDRGETPFPKLARPGLPGDFYYPVARVLD